MKSGSYKHSDEARERMADLARQRWANAHPETKIGRRSKMSAAAIAREAKAKAEAQGFEKWRRTPGKSEHSLRLTQAGRKALAALIEAAGITPEPNVRIRYQSALIEQVLIEAASRLVKGDTDGP